MEGLNHPLEKSQSPKLFNSTTEVGMRILFVLDAFHPRRLDLQTLSIYDYFVVHTGDIEGPISLHAPLQSRSGEYLVRRKAIQNAIAFLRRNHLIMMINNDAGQVYEITEDASALINVVSTEYHKKIQECASWLEMKSKCDSEHSFERNLSKLLANWNTVLGLKEEFSGD